MRLNPYKLQGFTLVELSIVIIIIGFLIAGISAGTSLINQVSLNRIITEAQDYITSINNFQIRYEALPGDFANAGAYWLSCDPTPTNCNGNGDGLIEWSAESYRAWQDLSFAGMISGIYNGTSQEPIAAYGHGTFWRIESNDNNIYTVPANTKNSLELLVSPGGAGDFISAVDAHLIDQKIDDGIPSNGFVYTIDNYSTGCVLEADGVTPALPTVYNSTDTSYNLTQTTPGCQKIYFYLE